MIYMKPFLHFFHEQAHVFACDIIKPGNIKFDNLLVRDSRATYVKIEHSFCVACEA